jgi:hypothetical protein
MIARQKSFELSGFGGDKGGDWTKTIDFKPGRVSAQVALFEVDGDGLHRAGILGYRYRPDPKGAEKVVHYGPNWSDWKSFVEVVDNMTAITWGIVAGGGQAVHARLDLFWWS